MYLSNLTILILVLFIIHFIALNFLFDYLQITIQLYMAITEYLNYKSRHFYTLYYLGIPTLSSMKPHHAVRSWPKIRGKMSIESVDL